MSSYKWKPEIYISRVERHPDTNFQNYMHMELRYIKNVKQIENKTVVDLGAGYGRVEKKLSEIARKVIAVELDDVMFSTLRDKTKTLKNVSLVKGDVNKLSEFISGENLVLISLQNSLGTWIGNRHEALKQIREVIERNKGEIIISLLNQKSLKGWGVDLIYSNVKEMVGEVDLARTNFEKGLFVSKTGYISKWYSRIEAEQISQEIGGTVISLLSTPYYHIIHNSRNK
ncbi:MAG: methyltransferase domain-containing protein [Candidatus Micrarchaeota archaeon]|nr:methyltransferase domain-containing protein [Candidatus Micrarchaeota archaeon]